MAPTDDESPEPTAVATTSGEEPDTDEASEDATDEASSATSDSHDSLLDPYLRTASRVVRAARGLFAAHVIVVRGEAQRELVRILIGLVLVVASAMCFFCTAILGSVSLVVAVQRFSGLPLLESLLICLSVTSSVGTLLIFIAWWRLWRPLMPQSRELLSKTLDGLGARPRR